MDDKKERKQRTTRQNRYYRFLLQRITPLYKDKGWNEHDTHRYLKSRFFVAKDEILDIIDRVLEYDDPLDILTDIVQIWEKATTTTLDTVEWEEKMRAIRMYYDSI